MRGEVVGAGAGAVVEDERVGEVAFFDEVLHHTLHCDQRLVSEEKWGLGVLLVVWGIPTRPMLPSPIHASCGAMIVLGMFGQVTTSYFFFQNLIPPRYQVKLTIRG